MTPNQRPTTVERADDRAEERQPEAPLEERVEAKPPEIRPLRPDRRLGDDLALRRSRIIWIPAVAGFSISISAWLAVPRLITASPEIILALQMVYGLIGALALLFVSLLAILGSRHLKTLATAVAGGRTPDPATVRGAAREAIRLPWWIGLAFGCWSLLLGAGTSWRGHVQYELPQEFIHLGSLLGIALGVFGGCLVGSLIRLQIIPFTRVLSLCGVERWPGRTRRFAVKVAVLCGLVGLTPALLTGVIGYHFASRQHREQLGADLVTRLSSSIEAIGVRSTSSTLERDMLQLRGLLHGRADLAIVSDGAVVASTASDLDALLRLAALGSIELKAGQALAAKTSCLLVFSPLPNGGAVLVRVPREALSEALAPMRFAMALLIGVTLMLSVLLGWTSARSMEAPLSDMARMTTRVARGDLADPGGRILTDDEYGQVTGEVASMRAKLASIVKRVVNYSEQIGGSAQQAGEQAQQVGLGAEAQGAAVTSVAKATEELEQGLREVGGTARKVARAFRGAIEAGARIDVEFEGLTSDLKALAHEATEAAAAVAELSKGSGLVAEDVSGLSLAAERATVAAGDADKALENMREHSGDAALATRRTITAARAGADSVRRTVEGMERIRSGSEDAMVRVENLFLRISEVDSVLSVIEEIAEKTNLLALNASIIAAQSGEQGKSFVVLAGEIRNLSTRTASSTREIAGTIDEVRRASREAVGAIRGGRERVEEGVELAGAAERSLGEIVDAAREAAAAAGEIATVANIQSRNVSEVRGEMDQVAGMAARLAGVGEAQARAAGDARRAAQRIAELTAQVTEAVTNATSRNHNLLSTFQGMGRPVEQVDSALKQQAKAMAEITEENLRIRDVALAAAELADRLDDSARSIEEASGSLITEVRYFRL